MVARWLIADAALLVALSPLCACSGSGPDGVGDSDGGTSLDSGFVWPGHTTDASRTSHDSGGAHSDGGGDGGDDGAPPSSGGGGGLFANCSLTAGCTADCSPPADDPISTGNAAYDLYDGCILAALQVAGMTEPWRGQLLKSQAYTESGISPCISTNDAACGGQNCGIWAISAGSVSCDDPPRPCGSTATDPLTGQVDYSHSYGLFQNTPACEGTFVLPTLPSGYTCTPTTKVDNITFGTDVTFYRESATSLGVSTLTGTNKGYINAVQKTFDPLRDLHLQPRVPALRLHRRHVAD